jgi:hypothetical protein
MRVIALRELRLWREITLVLNELARSMGEASVRHFAARRDKAPIRADDRVEPTSAADTLCTQTR